MQSAFPGLQITDLEDPKDLYINLFTSISQTLSSVAEQPKETRVLIKEKEGEPFLETTAKVISYRLPIIPETIDKSYWSDLKGRIVKNR